MKFNNAQEAFELLYDKVQAEGVVFDNTKALFNVGFYIDNPIDRSIDTDFRRWNCKYAEKEWQWYLSGDPNADEIAKGAPIWYKMMDKQGNVRSNYGWQWMRNNQLQKIVSKLRDNPLTRHAAISIYDGKEIDTYQKDTPCTYAVQFTIVEDKLNMSVLMRSNDLWYGFCNDQYCFSKLQQFVADSLKMQIGWYYHYAHNLHVYNNKLNK